MGSRPDALSLHAIAQFFQPLSKEEDRELRVAARRRARYTGASSSSNTDILESDGVSAWAVSPPVGATPPLAFAATHPMCRLASEQSPPGVLIGYTHFFRPPPPAGSTTEHVWTISAPPAPTLRVTVTRLPLGTCGLVESAWWLRRIDATHAPLPAVSEAGRLAVPVEHTREGIRLILEHEDVQRRRRPRRHGAVRDLRRCAGLCTPLLGSREHPVTDQELMLTGDAAAMPLAQEPLPFTSLELQQLCLHPSAMRVLPCLFGRQISCVLLAHCTCGFAEPLIDPLRSRYDPIVAADGDADGMTDFGVTVSLRRNGEETQTHYRYGAKHLSYLGVSRCGGEGMWAAVMLYFIFPQCSNASTVATMPLARLTILDISDNKALSAKRLRQMLHAVWRRNTQLVGTAEERRSSVSGGSAPCAQAARAGLRELSVSWTRAIRRVKWRDEFAGLGCHLRRLSLACCNVTGDALIDILCAGEDAAHAGTVAVPPPRATRAEQRRLQLLDVRWNIQVTSDTIRSLVDKHQVHCQHLRIAGTAIGRAEADLFANITTP
ncbi:hypothetical protein NESM_000459100 [Novymonas esmeraldas]|uniref:Uncharacterized protein n=1 Tax=Novymonas esmeraldas TaxID=1808958 RepID=A0AAW0EQ02_9TRYP